MFVRYDRTETVIADYSGPADNEDLISSLAAEVVHDIEKTGTARIAVAGEVPNPLKPPSGCAFHPRCPYANERCKAERPEMKPFRDSLVACHGVEEGRVVPTGAAGLSSGVGSPP